MLFNRDQNKEPNPNGFSRNSNGPGMPGTQNMPRPQIGFDRPDGYVSVNDGMSFNAENDFMPSEQPKGAAIQQNLLPNSRRHRSGLQKVIMRSAAIVFIIILLIAGIILSKGIFVNA